MSSREEVKNVTRERRLRKKKEEQRKLSTLGHRYSGTTAPLTRRRSADVWRGNAPLHVRDRLPLWAELSQRDEACLAGRVQVV